MAQCKFRGMKQPHRGARYETGMKQMLTRTCPLILPHCNSNVLFARFVAEPRYSLAETSDSLKSMIFGTRHVTSDSGIPETGFRETFYY